MKDKDRRKEGRKRGMKKKVWFVTERNKGFNVLKKVGVVKQKAEKFRESNSWKENKKKKKWVREEKVGEKNVRKEKERKKWLVYKIYEPANHCTS